MTEIKIPLSNTKIILLLIATLIFIIGGLWGIIEPERFTSFRYSKNFVFYSGLASILFFGLGFIFIAIKVFSGKPGLTINESGIIDNSNATSIGLIEWNDIIGIETIQIKMRAHNSIFTASSPKMILVKVKNSKKYIERSTNIITKQAMKANNSMYGTPLTIISGSLKIKFSELEKLISKELEKQKGKNIS